MYELTQAEKETLLRRKRIYYHVYKDGDIDIGKTASDRVRLVPTNHYGVCWCEGNKGARITDDICVHCGKNVDGRYNDVTSKEIVTKLKAAFETTGRHTWYAADNTNQTTLANFFYAKRHPDADNGLLILKIQLSLKGGKDTFEDETLIWKTVHEIEIIPGNRCRAYKEVRGKEVNVDLFDAMQLSSKTAKESPDILFEDSHGPIDFMLKAKKLNQYTGFMECFNMIDVPIPRASFFMFYMYLYAQYPAVEFVAKMGYMSLLTKIMIRIAQGYNKEYIREQAKELYKIINPEATNGSMALTVPKYIADDLNRKDAGINEYVLWGDIHQMTDGGVSKEKYIKWSRNTFYFEMKYTLEDIPNILKHGYDFGEVIKYVNKQEAKHADPDSIFTVDRRHYFVLWKDYLHMCDMLGVEHDKFPSDIKTAHDNVSIAYQAAQNKIADALINTIGLMAEAYIPENKFYTDSQYVISLPHSVNDIVQEGQNMHNCVGSYVNRIAKNETLVFFVRKKEEPTQSFITAEYRRGQLNQLYYKNNMPVSDTEIRAIATAFCEKLKNSHKFNF